MVVGHRQISQVTEDSGRVQASSHLCPIVGKPGTPSRAGWVLTPSFTGTQNAHAWLLRSQREARSPDGAPRGVHWTPEGTSAAQLFQPNGVRPACLPSMGT